MQTNSRHARTEGALEERDDLQRSVQDRQRSVREGEPGRYHERVFEQRQHPASNTQPELTFHEEASAPKPERADYHEHSSSHSNAQPHHEVTTQPLSRHQQLPGFGEIPEQLEKTLGLLDQLRQELDGRLEQTQQELNANLSQLQKELMSNNRC